MAQNTQALPPNAEGSKNQARFLRWRHLAHRGQMLSKSMLRPECWRSVPDPESMELGSERPCLSSQCLLDSSCHKRHVISELLTLAKQIDRSVALQVYEATKELFAWQRFEQTPMLFYPSFKAQEFLRSYHLRSGRLTPAEEEYSGRQGWWCWEVWSALEGWVKERCEQMPTLCRVLRQHLPASKSSTLAAYLQEEVALFGLPPGEKFFAPHNDGSNARVALLMPLTHGRYSALEERRAFGGDGHVLGFDASMDHFATYEAPPGVWDERWVLSIAVSHPQFDRHLAEGRDRTRPDTKKVTPVDASHESPAMSLAFVAPSVAQLEVRDRGHRVEGGATTKATFVGGYEGDQSVNHALTSMAAMFVVAGGVRWRERRQQTYQELVDKSEYLRDQHWTKTFHASFMGGAYVGMAGLLSLVIGGNMASQFITQKAVFAALFPINLLLVLTTGGQLFTGNSATMAIGIYEKKPGPYVQRRTVSGARAVRTGSWWEDLLRNWSIAYIGNIFGCLLIDAVATYTGMFTGGNGRPHRDEEVLCHLRADSGEGHHVQLAGVHGRDMTGKMVGVWFPISMFIAIGFEHSVANMFILPAGIFSGAPLSWGDILVKNLIPVTIGNAIAGAFVVGGGMSFMFGKLGKKEKKVEKKEEEEKLEE
eukprot:g1439.t1